jgi:hypothetical protein
MGAIHINRDGQSLGQFSEEEILAGLQSGQFKGTDLAWKAGAATWKPLSEFGLNPSAPPLVAGATAAGASAGTSGEAGRTGLAWDRRSEIGILWAIVETVQEVLLQPGPAFSKMKLTGGLGSPYLYWLIVGGISTLVALGYQLVFSAISEGTGASGAVGVVVMLVGGVLGGGFMILVLPFISGAITHLCLMLCGGAKRDFEATFRVVCFSQGTCALFGIVPICGAIIQGIYGLVVSIIGLQKVHETDLWRVILAVFLPVIFCCGLLVILFSLGFAAGLSGGFLEGFQSAFEEAFSASE